MAKLLPVRSDMAERVMATFMRHQKASVSHFLDHSARADDDDRLLVAVDRRQGMLREFREHIGLDGTEGIVDGREPELAGAGAAARKPEN
jgi:hypothetical protein